MERKVRCGFLPGGRGKAYLTSRYSGIYRTGNAKICIGSAITIHIKYTVVTVSAARSSWFKWNT
jgi:hypothetical protein